MVAATIVQDIDDSANTILPVSINLNEEDIGIWREVLASKKINQNQGSTVIILGENRIGKTSLLSRLDKSDRPRKFASLLEYYVLNVQNDARDASYAYQLGTAGASLNPSEMLHIPVWTLDGNENCSSLLKHALPPTPDKTIFMITGSIDNPNLIHSIRRWANVCTEQCQKIYSKEQLKEGRVQQERWWQEYVDPVESQMSTSLAGNFTDDHNLLPLDQGTLSENVGVSFIVVVTKSDLAKDLNDQQFAKTMIQLRKYCLAIGASIVFTSSNSGKNIQILQKYLVHRSFGMSFTNTAQVIEREGIFIPAGWDSEKKIDILRETVPDMDMVLEPTREKLKSSAKEQLIEAENDQDFLKKLTEQIQTTSASSAPSTARKIQQDEPIDKDSPLASFFSNLLKEKPGKSTGTSSIASQPMETTAVQLDRILKSATSSKAKSDTDA